VKGRISTESFDDFLAEQGMLGLVRRRVHQVRAGMAMASHHDIVAETLIFFQYVATIL
jgi:hypothetical protein